MLGNIQDSCNSFSLRKSIFSKLYEFLCHLCEDPVDKDFLVCKWGSWSTEWLGYGFTKNIINFSMQLRIYIVILLTCVKSHCLRNRNRCGGCSHLIGCIICQRKWIFNSQQGVVEPGGWAPFFLLSILPSLLSLHLGFDCPPPGTSLEAGCWRGYFLAFSFPSSFPPVNRKKISQAEGTSLVKFNFSFAGVLPIEACF